jgi:23S rRNA (cytidine1920-2'-O)/16S rRNA (cytidine1409-2'-O)-methyltransferase
MNEKQRIDVFLVNKGLAETRSKAQRMVMAGKVLINEIPVEKSSQTVLDSDTVRVKESLQYVSRGALKLKKAIESFGIDVSGKSFIDFGASTGGFTDVLLQNGAKHVSCVDVGYGQLAWKIRSDERVSVLERTNARYLTPQMIGGKKDAAVCDVSFISLTNILPAMDACTNDGAFIVVLIKPQFEAGREQVGKKGIVKDPKIHFNVIGKVTDFVEKETSFSCVGLDFSPITGQKGNIEYLLFAKKNTDNTLTHDDINNKIKEAFENL